MFKNRKKESAKKQKIRELTEELETNTKKYNEELDIYKKHINDNKLLLDNISEDYDNIIKDNGKLRDQLLKKDQDIFELKHEIQKKLQENVIEQKNFKFLLKEQQTLLDKERKKTHEYKRLYQKYHFMNTLLQECE
jgi:chromosome segregation ATPase